MYLSQGNINNFRLTGPKCVGVIFFFKWRGTTTGILSQGDVSPDHAAPDKDSNQVEQLNIDLTISLLYHANGPMNMMWSKEYNLHKQTHEYDVVCHNKSIRSFYLWLRAACPRPSALRANNNCLSVSAEIVVQMVDEVFDAHGLLEVFQEDVWVPLVLGLMHDVKELSPVIAMLGKKGLILLQTNRVAKAASLAM